MTKSSTAAPGTVKLGKKEAQAMFELLRPDFQAIVQQGVLEFGQMGARLLYELLMTAEVNTLCGAPYERKPDKKGVRWGSEPGKARAGGGKVVVERPRVRSTDLTEEISLTTYQALNNKALLTEPLLARLFAGISTRDYSKTLDKSLRKNGVSKSAVSRAAIEATKPILDEFLKRRLESLNLVVLMFDGIHLADRQMIACIGIDTSGKKILLGTRLGATENFIVCRDLIQDLKERGLKEDSPYLFVIDGSKALAQAIKAAFGDRAAIQRCQEHKIRNVQAYLPFADRERIRSKMTAAYNQKSERSASQRLEMIRKELSILSLNAEKALVEGLYETLTVHRLDVRGALRTSLRTTNIIESAFSSARRFMRRVTSHKDEESRQRWAIRSLLEAEKNFRRLKGHRQLSSLKTSLELHDQEKNGPVTGKQRRKTS